MTHPLAKPDVEWAPTREFWRGAAAGELRLPRCVTCARHQWYPRPRCARCGDTSYEWHPLPPRGVIYSYTVVKHPFPGAPLQIPFAVLQIVPDGAPETIVLANLKDEAQTPLLAIGAEVAIVFEQRDDGIAYPCAVVVDDVVTPLGGCKFHSTNEPTTKIKSALPRRPTSAARQS